MSFVVDFFMVSFFVEKKIYGICRGGYVAERCERVKGLFSYTESVGVS